MRVRWPFGTMAVCLSLWLLSSTASLGARDSFPMRTVDGRVLTVEHHQAEGGLEVVLVRLEVPGSPEGGLPILLAPESVTEEIGFQVQEGDRLRARIFVSDEGPSSVQKVQNFTRGTMVRLRTLHQTPLWNRNGSWQGGPMRSTPGGHQHGRNRGGGGSR